MTEQGEEQQRRVYRAQANVRAVRLLREFESYDRAQHWLDQMVQQWWWEERWPLVKRIELHKAEAGDLTGVVGVHAGARLEREHHGGVITARRSALTPLVLLHESAHIAADSLLPTGSAYHGPRWARTFLELVYLRFDSQAYLELQQLFQHYGVDVTVEA